MIPNAPPGRTLAARLKLSLAVCGALLIAILGAFVLVVRAITYHPQPVETVMVAGPREAPRLKPGQTLKIMSWNVQYLAGKERLFWYDVPDHYRGPVDTRPTPSDLKRTLHEVARIICEENPDVLLLQELDDGSKRTDYQNQLALLLALLPPAYSQQVEAFYHRARFVPERHLMGAVGMKLAILSKYRIQAAVRHQLPCLPMDLFSRQFYFKRAVLEARLPMENGQEFVMLNTHFDAWTAGTGTAEKQAAAVQQLLARFDLEHRPWSLGGDFNCLASGLAYERLPQSERRDYYETTALAPLFERYAAVPSAAEIAGADPGRWHTHWKNSAAAPDRAIDFLFFSRSVLLGPHSVRQKDPDKTAYLRISDHFPVIAEITLPADAAGPLNSKPQALRQIQGR